MLATVCLHFDTFCMRVTFFSPQIHRIRLSALLGKQWLFCSRCQAKFLTWSTRTLPLTVLLVWSVSVILRHTRTIFLTPYLHLVGLCLWFCWCWLCTISVPGHLAVIGIKPNLTQPVCSVPQISDVSQVRNLAPNRVHQWKSHSASLAPHSALLSLLLL